MKPRLSIVIPTKNRYEYLSILIQKLLSYESQEFEIIIQDNSDNNSTFKEFLNNNKDERIKYNHTEGWLSVIMNCDLGVQAAEGDWVCMLGDDDGLLLNRTLSLITWLDKNNYEACHIKPIVYSWPDITHAVWGDNFSGKIDNAGSFSNTATEYLVEDQLQKLLNKSGAFGLGNLPRVYHALVHRDVLNKLKEETGSYFPGPSPDMANAVGITKYFKKYVYVDAAVIISGHSKKSTAGQGGRKEHKGKIELQTHLPKETGPNWSPMIPYLWSGPTIYSESARCALKATDREHSHRLNYSALYACCLIYERHMTGLVVEKMLNNRSIFGKINIFFKTGLFAARTFIRRGYYFLRNIIKMKIRREDRKSASTIAEAIEILELEFDVLNLTKN